MLAAFNETVGKMWPCPLSMALGYIFAPFTLGLSLFLPNICVADAEKALQAQIDYYNMYRLKEKGLEVKLRKGCFTSWIEINIGLEPDEVDTSIKTPSKNYFRDEETGLVRNSE